MRRMAEILAMILVVVFLLTLTRSSSLTAAAGTVPVTFDQVLAEARQERGNLIVQTFYPTTAENRRELVARFNARFGLNVNVAWDPLIQTTAFLRAATEAKAGRQLPDLILLNNYHVEILRREAPAVVARYDWVGVFGQRIPSVKPARDNVEVAELKDIVLAADDLMYLLVYNTSLLRRDEAPRAFEELAEPRWRGNFGLFTVSAVPFAILAVDWGTSRVDALVKALTENNPVYKAFSPTVHESIALGEFPVGVGSQIAQGLAYQGRPISFRAPPEIPVLQSVFFVPVGQRQPRINLARLFAAWWTSPEGRSILHKEGFGALFHNEWDMLRILRNDRRDVKFVRPSRMAHYTELLEGFQSEILRKYYPGRR